LRAVEGVFSSLLLPMHVLLLSPRFPWPPFTGDRLRATIWLSALAREHEVTLISPRGDVPPSAPRFRFLPAAPSPARAAAGALRVLRGAPVQSLLAAPYDWAGAIARAGRVDATVVLLARLDPAVRGLLPCGLRVFDAIDSLGRSMDERSREGSPLLRRFWRAESRRVARVEDEAARVYDRVISVSADEATELRAEAISNGVVIAPLGDAPRTFDFAFWGRLAYFANADAATWLLREIWPAIRARLPRATLLLGGADAPSHIRAAHGRDGVTVQSPVDDVAALARRVKVALFPVRYGTGQSNKVLEAAEAGCAVVATAKAMRGLEPLHGHAFIADDAAAIARAAISALADESGAMRAAVETHFARQATLDRLAAVIQDAEAAA
jgi:glycosyltransferase involved in cell wall biosynthesis